MLEWKSQPTILRIHKCFGRNLLRALPYRLPRLTQTTAQTAAQTDSSYIDPSGTAHITRVIPVPKTISPEAQKTLRRPVSDAANHKRLAERRSGTDAWQARAGDASKAVYPVNISR